MARLAETYFRLSVQMSEYDRRALSEYLRALSTEIFRDTYGKDGQIAVVVLEGSTRVWIRAAGLSLVTLMAGYGAFRESIDYLVSDAREFGEKVKGAMLSTGLSQTEIEVFQRRLGVVGKIQRAMKRIDRLDSGNWNDTTERRAELERVKALLFDVVVELDAEDRQLFLSNVPLAAGDDLGNAPVRSLTWAKEEDDPAESAKLQGDLLNGTIYNQKIIREEVPKWQPYTRLSHEPNVRFDSDTGKLLRLPDTRLLPKR